MTSTSAGPQWAPLRSRAAWVASAVALAANLCARDGRAQDAADPAAARVLFAEGRKLAAEGKYPDACPKFEESLRLDRGMGTEFNLADCWDHLNRTASAWGLFLNVAAEAKVSGQSVREDLARSRAAALEPRLSRLIVEVPAPVAGLELRRDGALVGRASWGVPVPVDPGTHTLEVSAPGHKKWTSTIELSKPDSLTVQVPQLEPDASAPNRADTPPPDASRGAVSLARAPSAARGAQSSGRGGGQRVAALAVGGVAVVGLAVGTVYSLRTNSKNNAAKAICPSNENCTKADADQHSTLLSQAKSARTLSYVGFGVGGAALASAVILYLTAPSSSASGGNAHWSAAPLLASNTWGGVLEGTW